MRSGSTKPSPSRARHPGDDGIQSAFSPDSPPPVRHIGIEDYVTPIGIVGIIDGRTVGIRGSVAAAIGGCCVRKN